MKKLLIACVLSLSSAIATPSMSVAKAASTYYSDVLNDFLGSNNFDASIYPYIEAKADYSNANISLIDLKENVRGEIILYVYNPTGKAVATRVNISLTKTNPTYIGYSLILVSTSDSKTLQKYVVNGLTAPKTDIRNYLVSSIYRAPYPIKGEEIPDDKGQTIQAKVYAVSRLFTVSNANEDTEYRTRVQKTIEITDKFIGNVLYSSTELNLFVGKTSQNVTFCAFNTDLIMDDLYEIEIDYNIYDYTVLYKIPSMFQGGYLDENTAEYTNKQEIRNRVITSEEELDAAEGWWTNNTHKIKRITKTSNLLDKKSEQYDKVIAGYNKKSELSKYAWTLFFYECQYSKEEIYNDMDGMIYRINSQIAKEMTILRLKFISDGTVYNLGAIDDVSSGARDPLSPDAKPNWIIALILLIIIVIVIVSIAPGLIILLLKWLIKWTIKIIKAPFKFIKWLFKPRKKRRKY